MYCWFNLQSALRLKPSFTDAYNNMASALVQKGLIPQAVECYNAALQINPNLVCNLRTLFQHPVHSMQEPDLMLIAHTACIVLLQKIETVCCTECNHLLMQPALSSSGTRNCSPAL